MQQFHQVSLLGGMDLQSPSPHGSYKNGVPSDPKLAQTAPCFQKFKMASGVVNEVQDKFRYVHSCDVDAFLQIKIGTLEGRKNLENYQELLNDPQLKYSGLHQSWNEWVQLPIKYQDLPRHAELGITIWDVYDCKRCMTVGGTTVSLFGKYGTLRQGIHDLRVWPGKVANGDDKTPGKVSKGAADEMSKLAKLSKKHHKGKIMKVDWLDRLTFREIEMVNEKEKRNSPFFYLMIEFPRTVFNGVEHSIVYFEKDADEIEYVQVYPEIVTVPDPEISLENLVESKHHRLTRSIRSGTMSRELKPNAAKRDLLTAIISYPPSAHLTSEEKDLIWHFRFYLTSQKKALTKFLKCVNWNHSQETKQAIDVLHKWDPIDAVDALELLTPQFTNRTVRQYAVSRLKQSSDEDLLLYLLQLVQALRYDVEPTDTEKQTDSSTSENSDLSESGGNNTGKSEDEILDGGNIDEQVTSENENEEDAAKDSSSDNVFQSNTRNAVKKDSGSDLASFLVVRACTNDKIANFFYWYLFVECKDARDKKVTDMYYNIMRRFSKALLNGNHDCRRRRSMLGREQKFLDKITELVKQIQQFSGNRKKKIEKLQQLLDTPEYVSFEPLPLPLDPDIKVKGIIPHKASIFKSALMPMKLTFRTIQNKDYVAIFKNGDDLRQDQLVLQMISLMDKLLMREKLDLKLTPYNVLATSISQGLVQFIDSQAVAQILRDETSIQNFFRKYSPMEGAPYGIQPETMDCYVKSCAGYCVITYLLGVGDRHLDNLLLTKSGNLFHIDFGYILGRDPKPFPPPMKLSKEMVEGMGGTTSDYYQQFRKLCFTAFLHLRRYANLFLNLFSLMVDASVPDIALEPDKTVKKVQDKFRLDLTDEEAVQYLQGLIDESVSAVFASLAEQIHKFAQYWRR
ncbi:phosphatidylinositol 3-kinase catalytic subunit type 3-like isoform X2 [Hydractinia symbiolongicarpus]|uniref:phosphatidylinositol 3-kinase catalytic subunit type 3-like isoform X2 n=1 Tax=Hydractinia symbiolongicarpus TaxID=13093 RepID=UPI00254E1DCC|nr:phosphatidylinositol 3-kinase catalytic subunit type 3-like isoform X2 [Hydractinia symbiolongicarpus]